MHIGKALATEKKKQVGQAVQPFSKSRPFETKFNRTCLLLAHTSYSCRDNSTLNVFVLASQCDFAAKVIVSNLIAIASLVSCDMCSDGQTDADHWPGLY